MRSTYAQSINRQMKEPGLLIIEHDIEYAPQTKARFLDYCEKQPDRIHAAPYLLRMTEMEGQPLVWAHRTVNTVRVKELGLPKMKLAKLTNLFPANDGKKPIEVGITYGVWVQGGELESDYFALGFTYLPKKLWDTVFWRVSETDWTMIDTRLSEVCMLNGKKALLHWDCLVNHTGIMRDGNRTNQH